MVESNTFLGPAEYTVIANCEKCVDDDSESVASFKTSYSCTTQCDMEIGNDADCFQSANSSLDLENISTANSEEESSRSRFSTFTRNVAAVKHRRETIVLRKPILMSENQPAATEPVEHVTPEKNSKETELKTPPTLVSHSVKLQLDDNALNSTKCRYATPADPVSPSYRTRKLTFSFEEEKENNISIMSRFEDSRIFEESPSSIKKTHLDQVSFKLMAKTTDLGVNRITCMISKNDSGCELLKLEKENSELQSARDKLLSMLVKHSELMQTPKVKQIQEAYLEKNLDMSRALINNQCALDELSAKHDLLEQKTNQYEESQEQLLQLVEESRINCGKFAALRQRVESFQQKKDSLLENMAAQLQSRQCEEKRAVEDLRALQQKLADNLVHIEDTRKELSRGRENEQKMDEIITNILKDI